MVGSSTGNSSKSRQMCNFTRLPRLAIRSAVIIMELRTSENSYSITSYRKGIRNSLEFGQLYEHIASKHPETANGRASTELRYSVHSGNGAYTEPSGVTTAVALLRLCRTSVAMVPCQASNHSASRIPSRREMPLGVVRRNRRDGSTGARRLYVSTLSPGTESSRWTHLAVA